MPAPVHSDHGQGPVIVLLHGVGVGPESFDPMASQLPGHRVVVVGRPTGAGGGGLPLAEQVAELAPTLESLGAAELTLVGVSGGATLGLALALGRPGIVTRYVLHEPLVGRHAPELHARFRVAAERAAEGDAEAMDVVRAVMGDATWAALTPAARTAAIVRAPRWREEIAAFAAFDPTPESLAALAGTPILVTVGGRSSPERTAAAEALAELTGASISVVPGAANAAHLDAPAALAEIVLGWHPATAGSGGPR